MAGSADGVSSAATESSAAPELNRTLGLRTVVSTSAGLTFASSTFLVVVQAACLLVGDSAWIVIVLAGLLCALAAAAFSELNGFLPSINGIRFYVHQAFGERLSLITALTYMSVVLLVVGTEAYVLSHVLTAALPAIPPPVWIFLMLTVATTVNFYGIKVAGSLQDIITYSVVASIVTISVLGLAHANFHVPQPLATGGIGNVFSALGLAIFLFVGFEWVTPLAAEVKSTRSISTGMFIALGLLAVVYALVTTSMFALFPDAHGPHGRDLLFGTAAAREPTPHLIFAGAVLGSTGRWWMIVTSICMSLTTFNAGLIGVSRFVYGMANEQILPKLLDKKSVQFKTPYAAVLFIYVVALIVSAIVYYTQKFVLLVNLAAATESFIYALAAASVVALRRRRPDAGIDKRPFRMAGGLWLPSLTAALFALVGVGVFLTPGVEFWGAGIALAGIAGLWAVYIHFYALPKLTRDRAERAAKLASKPSRRPPKA